MFGWRGGVMHFFPSFGSKKNGGDKKANIFTSLSDNKPNREEMEQYTGLFLLPLLRTNRTWKPIKPNPLAEPNTP